MANNRRYTVEFVSDGEEETFSDVTDAKLVTFIRAMKSGDALVINRTDQS